MSRAGFTKSPRESPFRCRTKILGVNHGVSLPNAVGVIDSDYRGEILVGITNCSNKPYTLQPGERCAQLVVMPVLLPVLEETDELGETGRGAGAFGSTGKQGIRKGKTMA